MSGRDAWTLRALAHDIVRRGRISPTWFEALTGPTDPVNSVRNSVAGMGVDAIQPPSEGTGPIDYMALLSGGGWGRHGQPE